MLSYQHLYHAGNPADVHKHAMLCVILDYLRQKPKPLTYLETHSGRGLYDLASEAAQKTGEAAKGILKYQDRFDASHPYLTALNKVRAQHGAGAYPGSPMLAQTCLRPDDTLHFAELHPQEFAALSEALADHAICHHEDGFQMVHRICPPTPRRGLLLIDPSYEIKSDYAKIPDQMSKLHRKWNVGVICLWYPVLTNQAHAPMLDALEHKAFPKTLRHEVRFPPVRAGHRMIGSGLFMINAPYIAESATRDIDAVFATDRT